MDVKATNQVNIEAVLQQMRTLRDAAQGPARVELDRATQIGTTSPTNNQGFRNIMSSAISSVNTLQQTAARSSEDFVMGKENDLLKVMIDSQKASIGFQSLVQVRNRMVTAYQDIMNMPI